MGFKDKVRNNQNAEHATIEDYRRSVQEKYVAERALRGKPIVVEEVPTPIVAEPVKPLIGIKQAEEAPAFVKSRVFESPEPEQEETVEEPEEKKVLEMPSEEKTEKPEEEKIEIEKVSKPTKPAIKPSKKNTKVKKKDPTNT